MSTEIRNLIDTAVSTISTLIDKRLAFNSLWLKTASSDKSLMSVFEIIILGDTDAVINMQRGLEEKLVDVDRVQNGTAIQNNAFTVLKALTLEFNLSSGLEESELDILLNYLTISAFRVIDERIVSDGDARVKSFKEVLYANPWLVTLILLDLLKPKG